jgi:hypothetical protein
MRCGLKMDGTKQGTVKGYEIQLNNHTARKRMHLCTAAEGNSRGSGQRGALARLHCVNVLSVEDRRTVF